ncbi:SnoaL-like domain protein [compost metagenome]
MSEQQRAAGMTIERLRAFGEAWNAQDIDTVMAIFSDDCLLHLPMGPGANGIEIRGQQAVREAVLATFQRNPDARVIEVGMPLFDSRGAVIEWYLAGADGGVQLHGCDIYQFDGGRISAKKVYIRTRLAA